MGKELGLQIRSIDQFRSKYLIEQAYKYHVPVYDYYKDQFEHDIRAATYLMTAHGACLIGCFTVLKEVAANDVFKGVGFFIWCFLWGLFFAIFGYVFSVRARAILLIKIMASGPKTKFPTFIEHMSQACQIISFFILILSLSAIATRLGKL